MRSPVRQPAGGRLVFGVFQLVFWGLFGLLFFLTLRPSHPFSDILLHQTAAATLLGLGLSTLLPPVYAVLRRRVALPLLTIAGTVLCSVLIGLAWHLLTTWVGELLNPFRFPLRFGTSLTTSPFAPLQTTVTFPAILLFWSMLYLSAAQWQHLHAQKERLLKADALAHEARLRMLRYQLNPHFLFNALNSIGALAEEAPHRIQRMVGELSGFLRYSLLDPDTFEVPLGEEVRAVAHYLAVEEVRFEEDLEVTQHVTPEAADRPVPAFLVLPLVENAIKYGQHTSPMPLCIRIEGHIEDGALCIEVANTGRWMEPTGPAAAAGSTGTGLDNVRQRLREQYPEQHRFELFEQAGWVHARIWIDDATG